MAADRAGHLRPDDGLRAKTFENPGHPPDFHRCVGPPVVPRIAGLVTHEVDPLHPTVGRPVAGARE